MKALFNNPKMALVYVGITAIGVALFVGTEDNPGTLHQTVETFDDGQGSRAQTAQREKPTVDRGAPPSRLQKPAQGQQAADNASMEFATEDDLLDLAEGFTPTPLDTYGGFDPTPSQAKDGSWGDGQSGGWGGETPEAN